MLLRTARGCWPVFSLGCFWGVLHLPIVQYVYPSISVQRLLHPHKSHGMQNQSAFNN